MATRVFQPRFGWSLVAFVLTACGGGGGTGCTQSSPLATSQVLSGRVIYQSAIPDARVSIRDAAGQTWEAVGDANGDYSITIANSVQITPPLLVRATGQGKRWSNESGSAARAGAFTLTPALVPTQVDKSGGAITPFTMYAVANDVGVTHVTPASTVVVDLLSGNRSDAAFANLGKVGTTVAVALDRSLVQTAVTQVRQGLSQLNLPSALLDNPTSPGLVSVDLTSTYDKLVSGDVLGALSQFVSALQTNQIDYGCNGEAFGTIADDGQRRPSCLAGANQDVSWMVTPFLLLETPRSLDVETRATELSDGNADGGGWKFQPTRVVRDQRAANLQAKIVAAFRNRDVSGQLSGTATEVLAVLTSWDDATWSAFNNQLCKTVSADELSDLAYSYLALKKDMRASVKSENNDAAENLLGAASEVGFKTRSINRVLPTFFQSGSGVDTCPILTKTVAAVRSQVTQYKSSPARASLASLMSAVRAEAQALVTAALHQRVSYVDVDFVTPFLTAAANLDVAYNLSLFQ